MSADYRNVLALLALAAESPRADIETFVDGLDVDELVVLIAGLADLALKGMTEDITNAGERAALCVRLRARLAAEAVADGV